MRTRLMVGALAAFVMSAGLAPGALAHGGEKHAVAQTAEGEGVVRNVNARAGTITVHHDPIPALRWPAMTMTFPVQSAAMLNGISVGARVHFVLTNHDGRPLMTEIHVL